MYIFRGRGVFIDVSKANDKIATSLADIDLLRTYRAIDSVATGSIPSLLCDLLFYQIFQQTGYSSCHKVSAILKLNPFKKLDEFQIIVLGGKVCDKVAEWLRRWTANPFPSGSVGSNPILVEIF